MNCLHLQLALDHCTLAEAERLTRLAAPIVNTIEVGTPLLFREGVAALHALRPLLAGTTCLLFADTKISDEGETIATLCLEAGADAVSVVDGASTQTLRQVRTVAARMGRQVWVDLLYHSNPIIRARALSPFVDGFILHRPHNGFPRPLMDGLLAIDRPIRLAGGITPAEAQRAVEFGQVHAAQRAVTTPMEGFIVGRAITEAKDPAAVLATFAAICGNG